MPTRHLLMKGKVQGVFYRASAKTVAQKLGLTGWVKNTAEGDVEAMVSGTEEQIRSFIDWCWKGPSRAVVSSVHVEEREELPFTDFSIRRD
jgi:acylphosphatase